MEKGLIEVSITVMAGNYFKIIPYYKYYISVQQIGIIQTEINSKPNTYISYYVFIIT